MEELLRTALLGTTKKALNVALLPLPIQKALLNTSLEDKEDLLLKAASLCIKYNNAGKRAPHLNLKELVPAPVETKKIAGQDYPANFLMFLETFKKTQKIETLNDFIDKMSAENIIFPPEFLVQILNVIPKNLKSEKKFIAKLNEVIGERGKWLFSILDFGF